MPKYFKIPDDIQQQIEAMLTVDDGENLDQSFEDNIGNEGFISGLLYDTNDTLIDHESQLDMKKRELRLKYITGNTTEADIEGIRLNRSEIDAAIQGSISVVKLNQKIKELTNMVKYYERALYNIRNKGFALKNILDYRKWKSGAN